MLIKLRRLFVLFTMLIVFEITSSAPKTWPYMKNFDIWETNKTLVAHNDQRILDHNLHDNSLVENRANRSLKARVNARKAKGKSSSCIIVIISLLNSKSLLSQATPA